MKLNDKNLEFLMVGIIYLNIGAQFQPDLSNCS